MTWPAATLADETAASESFCIECGDDSDEGLCRECQRREDADPDFPDDDVDENTEMECEEID